MCNKMRNNIEDTGFTAPAGRKLGHERRTVALAALIASCRARHLHHRGRYRGVGRHRARQRG